MSAPSVQYTLKFTDPIDLDYALTENLLNEHYPTSICVYFNNGEDCLPGTYTLKYMGGCGQYGYSGSDYYVNRDNSGVFLEFDISDAVGSSSSSEAGNNYDTVLGYRYSISDQYEVGFVVCHGGGKTLCPGSLTAETVDDDVVETSINTDRTVTFTHTGGPIAIYLHCWQNPLESDHFFTPSVTHETPNFVIFKNDEAAEYECGSDIELKHTDEVTCHIKTNGTNTFTLSGNITVSQNSTVKISYHNSVSLVEIYDSGALTPGSYPFTTSTLADAVPDRTTYEKIFIEAINSGGSTNSESIVNFIINIDEPTPADISAFNVTGPLNGITVTSSTVEFTWDIPTCTDSILHYDVMTKLGSDPWINQGSVLTNNATIDLPINSDGASYQWKVIAYTSNDSQESNTVSFTISQYALQNVYVRPVPVSQKQSSIIRLNWVESNQNISKFRIYRGHSYYDSGESVTDWKHQCDIDYIDGQTSYSIDIDLSKDSSLSGTYSPTPDEMYSDAELTRSIVKNILYRIDHNELWFRIEAISDTIPFFDLKYIVHGSGSALHTGDLSTSVSCLASKTIYLDSFVEDGTRTAGASAVAQELEPLWITKTPAGVYDASRTAIDVLGKFHDRSDSAWVNFRGSSYTGRFKITSGLLEQLWNVGSNSAGPNPRGIVIEPRSGDAYSGSGLTVTPRSNVTKYLTRMTREVPGSIPATYSAEEDHYQVIDGAGAANRFQGSYGSVFDKWGRVWFVDNYQYIICIDTGTVNAVTPGTKVFQSANYGNGAFYGISLDFFGNIWVAGSWGKPSKIYGIRIDPATGSINPTITEYPTASVSIIHYAIACDIPVGNTFNIWLTSIPSFSSVTKVSFSYNQATNSYTKTNLVFGKNVITDGVDPLWHGPHGIGITGDNDIITFGISSPTMVKIYQKTNDTSYPNGGLQVYHNRNLSTGDVDNSEPTSTSRTGSNADHPMWHPMYDQFDSNFSLDLNLFHRYHAWKQLHNTRVFPHYKRVGTHSFNLDPHVSPVCQVVASTVSLFNTNGVSTGSSWDVARLVYVNDYANWASYLYSDFTGWNSYFSLAEYPVISERIKFNPPIYRVL